MARAGADSGAGTLSSRDVLFLGAGSVVAALLVPMLPFVGVPLAALALGWLTYQGRTLVAVGFALVAAAVVAAAALQPAAALVVGPMLLLCGPFAARALLSRPAGRVVLEVAGALSLVSVGALAYDILRSGRTPLAFYEMQVQDYTEFFATALSAMPSEVDTVRELVRSALELWPSGMIVTAALTAVLSVAAVTVSAQWSGARINRLPRLGSVDLSVHAAWPAVIGMLLLAAAMFNHATGAWYAVVGRNLLLVIGRSFLLVQGFAVYAGLYDRAKLGRGMRTFGFSMLVVTELLLPLVSLTGLADLWMNFRKLPRDGAVDERPIDER